MTPKSDEIGEILVSSEDLERRVDELGRQISSDYSVTCFHGQLKAEEKEEAIRKFRVDHQVLISTEAGGEGRNLQFAHVLINYDLPWNPMKVEQRIGRIDRIGQKHAVTIFNMSTLGTIEAVRIRTIAPSDT